VGPCGIFGCSRCLEKAITVDHCKQYLQHTTTAPLRTKDNSIFFARMAQQYDAYDSVCGVKTPSICAKLTEYDYAADCVIDPMHHLYMHVVKDMLTLWFSEKYEVHTVLAIALLTCCRTRPCTPGPSTDTLTKLICCFAKSKSPTVEKSHHVASKNTIAGKVINIYNI
jgi:hypothetical protein